MFIQRNTESSNYHCMAARVRKKIRNAKLQISGNFREIYGCFVQSQRQACAERHSFLGAVHADCEHARAGSRRTHGWIDTGKMCRPRTFRLWSLALPLCLCRRIRLLPRPHWSQPHHLPVWRANLKQLAPFLLFLPRIQRLSKGKSTSSLSPSKSCPPNRPRFMCIPSSPGLTDPTRALSPHGTLSIHRIFPRW